MVELLVVMGLIVGALGASWPLMAAPLDAGRARQAAGFIAAALRRARQEAVSRSTTVALVFDRPDGRWLFRVCADGNANGVRRADVARGKDSCSAGPYDLMTLFPGVSIAVDPALPGLDGGPGTADAVRMGSSDIASFSATGSATAGTVFVRSPKGAQYAIRVASVTGRTRLLRYDTGARAWVE